MLLCAKGNLFAQSPSIATEDVVYLKNGGIYRGRMLDTMGGKTIRIELAGKDVYVVNTADIERVEMEKNYRDRYRRIVNAVKQKGFYHVSEVFLDMWGVSNKHYGPYDYYNEQGRVGLSIVNGYRFHPMLNLGIRTGIEAYDGVLFFPLAVEIRSFIGKERTVPYFFATGGYSFSQPDRYQWGTSYYGGWLISGGGGIAIRYLGSRSLLLGLAYKGFFTKSEYRSYGDPTLSRNEIFERLLFSIGMGF